jgi:hypothetical protein
MRKMPERLSHSEKTNRKKSWLKRYRSKCVKSFPYEKEYSKYGKPFLMLANVCRFRVGQLFKRYLGLHFTAPTPAVVCFEGHFVHDSANLAAEYDPLGQALHSGDTCKGPTAHVPGLQVLHLEFPF